MSYRRLSWALLPLALACSPRDKEATVVVDTTVVNSAIADTGHTATPARPSSGNPKIDEALSAAPASIAQNATVMDWPDSAGGKPKELRHGSNDWTCFPSSPAATGAAGKDPMCLNKEFAAWGEAWMAKKPPHLKAVGIGYMLQGDVGASNTDPYATAETPENQWVHSGPHLMIATPDPAQLSSVPTDPKNGGPWVMWKGTPYAHVMMPVQ